MRQMTCAQMGGPATCAVVISGAAAEDMVKNGMDHVMQSHPEMAADIKKMTPEQTTAWMADFKKKFEALADI